MITIIVTAGDGDGDDAVVEFFDGDGDTEGEPSRINRVLPGGSIHDFLVHPGQTVRFPGELVTSRNADPRPDSSGGGSFATTGGTLQRAAAAAPFAEGTRSVKMYVKSLDGRLHKAAGVLKRQNEKVADLIISTTIEQTLELRPGLHVFEFASYQKVGKFSIIAQYVPSGEHLVVEPDQFDIDTWGPYNHVARFEVR